MEKHIVDEKTGISYTLQGDYYIPDLTLPPEKDTRPIGIWGMRYRDYLKNHRKATYTILLMNSTLHTHLADINEQAEDMFSRLVKQLAENEGITEQLKAENQMEWVGKMNNIYNQAREIVNMELIYV